MKRCLTTAAIVVLCLIPLRADVTVTQTMTIEGGMAAMMGGAAPRLVTRIKGLKSRADMEVMGRTISTITDLSTRQLIVLNTMDKTAQVFGPGSPAVPGAPETTLPSVDVTFKPTGQSRLIEGAQCDEHSFAVTMNMAEMAASPQAPPEAAEMMKDLRMVMNGSVWIAKSGPGVADYVSFQKAAMDANMIAALGGLPPGQQSGGLDRMFAAASSAPGLPFLTEMTMVFEGSGPLVDMMKQMGPMKMSQTVTAVSTEPISDDLFRVPDGFTVVKQ